MKLRGARHAPACQPSVSPRLTAGQKGPQSVVGLQHREKAEPAPGELVMGAPRCLGDSHVRSPSPILAPSPKTTTNSSWRSPSRRFLFPTTSPFPLDKRSFLVGSGGQYWQEMSLDLSGRLALWSYDSSSAVVNRGANHPRPCCQQPARAAPGRAGSLWGRGCPAGSTAALQGRR